MPPCPVGSPPPGAPGPIFREIQGIGAREITIFEPSKYFNASLGGAFSIYWGLKAPKWYSYKKVRDVGLGFIST